MLLVAGMCLCVVKQWLGAVTELLRAAPAAWPGSTQDASTILSNLVQAMHTRWAGVQSGTLC